ncbi:MAG: hypothetical protein Q9214_005544, partial [Letrouitia sp. 1 TL-2023]
LANNDAEKGPVATTAGPPKGVAFQGQLVGLMQAVYSYGGATLFVEFMAEMRRPYDFWKGMICAQTFIFCCYLVFGLLNYSRQGQFTINPVYQGVAPYNWQTVGNSLSLVSTLIAALLYGNIGIKVIYSNIFMELFKFPSLAVKSGKLIWVAVVPIYWAAAFVIAAAIPSFSNLQGLIAAACILQFSYTFPPLLMIGLQSQKDAIQDGEGFDPATGQTTRHDSGFSRWMRGFCKSLFLNLWYLFFFLGSVVTAVLGIYSAIVGLAHAYAETAVSGRKGIGDQVQEKLTPDSQKSTTEQASEKATTAGDKVAASLQPGDSKSTAQKLSDESRSGFDSAQDTAKSYGNQASDFASNAQSKISESLPSSGEAQDTTKSYANQASDLATNASNKISESLPSSGEAQDTGKSLLDQASELASNAAKTVSDTFSDVANKISGESGNNK